MVNQPEPVYAAKRRPERPRGDGVLTQPLTAAGVTYLYTSAYQYKTALGMYGALSQHRPAVAPADYHSLAELAAQSSDGMQIVEVGWNVDRQVNGDDLPHLFVYAWVNGAETCYNGCGWVQTSATRYPGMALTVTNTPQSYAIKYSNGKWWIAYQGEWIGYFPASMWGGSFTQIGLAQWFGEVAGTGTSPCTDMGNAAFGTSPASAIMKSLSFFQPTYNESAATSPLMTHSTLYNIGGFAGNSFRYGGPGGC